MIEQPVAVTIVPMAEMHFEGFHAALDAVARERRYLAFLEAPPLEQVREFVALTRTGALIQYVAVDEGRVVGWCDLIRSDRPAMRHGGMLGVGLLREARGQGLGARLITSVITAAHVAGVVRVGLHVRADNARAIRLYEKLGFQHEGRLRRNIRVDGIAYDSLLMAILLDEAGSR